MIATNKSAHDVSQLWGDYSMIMCPRLSWMKEMSQQVCLLFISYLGEREREEQPLELELAWSVEMLSLIRECLWSELTGALVWDTINSTLTMDTLATICSSSRVKEGG